MLLPCCEEIKQLRSNDAGKNRHQTHVPHRVRINTLLTGKVNGDKQSDDQTRGNKHAVGGNKEMSNLEKAGRQGSCWLLGCLLLA